jgi:hypothetical protein
MITPLNAHSMQRVLILNVTKNHNNVASIISVTSTIVSWYVDVSCQTYVNILMKYYPFVTC